jgi:hypothetical protein
VTTYNKTCVACGEPFATTRSNKKFCGYACACKPGVRRPKSANGAGSVTHYGYRMIRVNGRRVFEHRYVMEQHIGRPLNRREVVHHKDGNKLNNDISNLELLESQSEHTETHRFRFASETHKECCLCGVIKPRSDFAAGGTGGTNKDPNAGYCRPCSNAKHREWKERRKQLPPLPCSVCGKVTLSCRVNSKQRCSRCHRAAFPTATARLRPPD